MTLRWVWIVLLLAGSCIAAAAGDMPQDQKQFIQIVERFDRAHTQANSDLERNATRVQRAKAICEAIRTPVVQNWTGTVSKVSSSPERKGIVKLALSSAIWVATSNDAISDIGQNTLLNPGSPLFDQIVLLKLNQQVLFSGSFIPDSTDCFKDTGSTFSGSMVQSDFLFRFSDISPLPYQVAPHQATFPRGD
jgi:hypothetical protein